MSQKGELFVCGKIPTVHNEIKRDDYTIYI